MLCPERLGVNEFPHRRRHERAAERAAALTTALAHGGVVVMAVDEAEQWANCRIGPDRIEKQAMPQASWWLRMQWWQRLQPDMQRRVQMVGGAPCTACLCPCPMLPCTASAPRASLTPPLRPRLPLAPMTGARRVH